jgi:hypothetical protein
VEPKGLIEWLAEDMALWDKIMLPVNQDGKRQYVAVPHIQDQKTVLRFMRERLAKFKAEHLSESGA